MLTAAGVWYRRACCARKESYRDGREGPEEEVEDDAVEFEREGTKLELARRSVCGYWYVPDIVTASSVVRMRLSRLVESVAARSTGLRGKGSSYLDRKSGSVLRGSL